VPPILDSRRPALALTLAAAGALGVLSSFIGILLTFSGLESQGTSGALIGADNELGYPSSAFAMVLFILVVAVSVAELAGAAIGEGWWLALTPVVAIGTIFEIWASYLAFTPLLLVQTVLMAGALTIAIVRMPKGRTDAGIGIFLTVASIIGFFAAFRLTVDKVGTILDPSAGSSCDVSVLVQCGTNLKSWQGSLFGFPNPLLGIGGWMAALAVGIMLLAGLRFSRWFWIIFNIGVAGALALVCWLIFQSIFILGTLCPWCMATWSVTIPTFWLVTLYNLKHGNIPVPQRAKRFFEAAYGWVPLLTFASYVVVIVLAQLRLDVIHHL